MEYEPFLQNPIQTPAKNIIPIYEVKQLNVTEIHKNNEINIKITWDKTFYFDYLLIKGIEKDYALNILQEINPKYFDELKSITFMYSNPVGRRDL